MCVCIHYSAGQVAACPGCPHEELDDPMHPAYNCPVRPGGLQAMRARVTALETAGEGLKRDSSAAIEAISHAIHDPTTWPGIDWSGADVAAKQYEKAVATWDEAMKGAE